MDRLLENSNERQQKENSLRTTGNQKLISKLSAASLGLVSVSCLTDLQDNNLFGSSYIRVYQVYMR